MYSSIVRAYGAFLKMNTATNLRLIDTGSVCGFLKIVAAQFCVYFIVSFVNLILHLSKYIHAYIFSVKSMTSQWQ